jgi:hypothetical protein
MTCNADAPPTQFRRSSCQRFSWFAGFRLLWSESLLDTRTNENSKLLSIYNSCLSHSTSLARALPRCEILFFSTFGISAYVWPSYSKQASQPGKRKEISKSVSFIPPKRVHEETYRNQSAHEPQQSNPKIQRISNISATTDTEKAQTYRCPSLEDNRLMAGTLAVSESADCLSSLVLEARKQLVELRDAEGLEEPFPAMLRISPGYNRAKGRKE